jgi:lysophospholipase L1-like esterase
MKLQLRWHRSPQFRQRKLGFLDRSLRRERVFKQSIVVATGVVIAIILMAVPWGRNFTSSIALEAQRTTRGLLWHERRAVVEAYWRDYRQHGIEVTRPLVARFYHESSPPLQRLLEYAGMDPDHVLLRWANVTWTVLLSSKVFEADDTGRSYRLRPNTRSVWLKNVGGSRYLGVSYLVPDGRGLAAAIEGTPAVPMESTRQTTNSWGVRGPEPELDAPLRVLVLGDSFMQGLFVGDEDTPSESLRRDLQSRLQARVSVLNTGVIGYSPEQYYYTLLAFEERFTPHAVVISICANDFGNVDEAVNEGKGDWQEGKYWLEKIVKLCESRHWTHLMVAVPIRSHVVNARRTGRYPGAIVNILNDRSVSFLDPLDEFVNAHLDAEIAGKPARTAPGSGLAAEASPLFNDPLNDDHFSALGSAAWGRAVGRRLALLLKRGDRSSRPSSSPRRGAN